MTRTSHFALGLGVPKAFFERGAVGVLFGGGDPDHGLRYRRRLGSRIARDLTAAATTASAPGPTPAARNFRRLSFMALAVEHALDASVGPSFSFFARAFRPNLFSRGRIQPKRERRFLQPQQTHSSQICSRTLQTCPIAALAYEGTVL